MGKIKNYFLWAAFFFIFSGTVSGQTVILKSGQRVEGKIVEQTDKFLKMEFEGVGLIFYNEEIASIEQAPLAADLGASAGQMEKFYQGFLAARNAPEPAPEEAASLKTTGKESESKQGQEEKTPPNNPSPVAIEPAPAAKEGAYVSGLPPEDRQKLKENLSRLKFTNPAAADNQ